jgi:hypothetical protein
MNQSTAFDDLERAQGVQQTQRKRNDGEGPTPAMKDPCGNPKAGIAASAKINRKDFGLVWNALVEAGGVLVGDQVWITVEVEWVQKASA